MKSRTKNVKNDVKYEKKTYFKIPTSLQPWVFDISNFDYLI